jgi:hypothetical protein
VVGGASWCTVVVVVATGAVVVVAGPVVVVVPLGGSVVVGGIVVVGGSVVVVVTGGNCSTVVVVASGTVVVVVVSGTVVVVVVAGTVVVVVVAGTVVVVSGVVVVVVVSGAVVVVVAGIVVVVVVATVVVVPGTVVVPGAVVVVPGAVVVVPGVVVVVVVGSGSPMTFSVQWEMSSAGRPLAASGGKITAPGPRGPSKVWVLLAAVAFTQIRMVYPSLTVKTTRSARAVAVPHGPLTVSPCWRCGRSGQMPPGFDADGRRGASAVTEIVVANTVSTSAATTAPQMFRCDCMRYSIRSLVRLDSCVSPAVTLSGFTGEYQALSVGPELPGKCRKFGHFA